MDAMTIATSLLKQSFTPPKTVSTITHPCPKLQGTQKAPSCHTGSSPLLLSPADPQLGARQQYSPVHLLSAYHPPMEGDGFLSLLSNLWRR